MNKIRLTDEWKEIVAREDPEYVKKNEDGSKTYLIDDYVVKKKHPLLDIASDIAAGRKISVNAITKDTVAASIRDYAVSAVNMGILATGVVTAALTEKFKFQQGSYDDDIRELASTVEQGAEYAKSVTGETPTVSKETIEKVAESIKMAKTSVANSSGVDTVKNINEGNVIKAAQVLMESETMQNVIGSNEYYRLAESALSNMSDEEMAALSLLLRQMYSQ